jgi:hypothetical protein
MEGENLQELVKKQAKTICEQEALIERQTETMSLPAASAQNCGGVLNPTANKADRGNV